MKDNKIYFIGLLVLVIGLTAFAMMAIYPSYVNAAPTANKPVAVPIDMPVMNTFENRLAMNYAIRENMCKEQNMCENLPFTVCVNDDCKEHQWFLSDDCGEEYCHVKFYQLNPYTGKRVE